MGRKIKHHAKLLERMFSRSEWEYLKRHSVFKLAIKKFNVTKDETLSKVDALSLRGSRLLQTWEDANTRAQFVTLHEVRTARSKAEQSPVLGHL